jgi:hypothetical protein
MREIIYSRQGDWSSVTLYEGATGWIYTQRSQIAGSRDNRRVNIPYGYDGYQRGQDMDAMHNDHITVGDALCHAAADAPDNGCKLLQTGTIVE